MSPHIYTTMGSRFLNSGDSTISRRVQRLEAGAKKQHTDSSEVPTSWMPSIFAAAPASTAADLTKLRTECARMNRVLCLLAEEIDELKLVQPRGSDSSFDIVEM